MPFSSSVSSQPFVTLVATDSYNVGAIVLAHSLRKTGTLHPIVVLVTPQVSADNRARLAEVFNQVISVDSIDSNDEQNLELLGRPDLGITLTKLYVWSLTNFSKIVFLDADTMVLQNIDDLFDRQSFSACPDSGWPDCFNSGVFVTEPNLETFHALIHLANTMGSFDGGDQGLLNSYFNSWAHGDPSRRIPFTYNLTFSASYSYAPAYAQFKNSVKVVHFIGQNKPWLFNRFSADGAVIPFAGVTKEAVELIQMWWSIHDEFIPPLQGFTVMPSYAQHDILRAESGYQSSARHSAPTVQEDFMNYRVQWNQTVEKSVNKTFSQVEARVLPGQEDIPSIRVPLKNK